MYELNMMISNLKAINLFKLSRNVGEPLHFSSKCGDFIGLFPKSFLDHVIGFHLFISENRIFLLQNKNH